MPSADPELTDQIAEWFGPYDLDSSCIRFLESHGWVLARSGMWSLPVSGHRPSCYEMKCLWYLCDEWDYGYGGGPEPICLCGEMRRGMH